MKFIVRSFLFAGLLLVGFTVSAQSVQEAGDMFNQGNQQFKAKAFSKAVDLYEQALQIAEAAGPDAFELQGKIENQLATALFWNGINFYKQRQFDKAIAQMQKSLQMADKAQNAKIKNYDIIYIARVYASKGNALLKKKDYTGAEAAYAAALKVNPKSINAYFGKSLLYKETKSYDKMIAMVDKVGEYVNTNRKGPQMYAKVKRMAYGALLNAGASELQKEHPAKALGYLNQSLKFNSSSASTYYYMAIANLKLRKYTAAITNAKKALSLPGNDKSDIYFTLAQAYQKKGDKANACNAFKHVVKGPNVAAAKYQRSHVLKCK